MYRKSIIITGPSGAGKSTLCTYIQSLRNDLVRVVSATTRPPRAREEHGKDYFFLDYEEFNQKIEAGEFLEWEEFVGNKYGILKSEFERIWQMGKFLITNIEIRGAHTVKKKFGDHVLAIFVAPPSLDILRERLVMRGSDTPSVLEERIERAREEMKSKNDFDVLIVNDNLEQAKKDIERVVYQYLDSP